MSLHRGGRGPFHLTRAPIGGGGPSPPANLWSADFSSGVYSVAGAPSSLGAMFGEDSSNWGNFDTANVVGGTGLVGTDAGTSSPIVIGAALAAIVGGATYVATFNMDDGAVLKFLLSDFPDYSAVSTIQISNDLAGCNYQISPPGDIVGLDNAPAASGTAKAAFTVTDSKIAYSVQGSATQAGAGGPGSPNAFAIALSNNGAGNAPALISLVALPVQDDTALPGLST